METLEEMLTCMPFVLIHMSRFSIDEIVEIDGWDAVKQALKEILNSRHSNTPEPSAETDRYTYNCSLLYRNSPRRASLAGEFLQA